MMGSSTLRPLDSLTPDSGVYTSLSELVRLQHKARGFSFLPRQPIHSLLAGKHASKLRGRGLNFEELRNYLPGDDIRTMDWKATFRSGKPYVRVFTEERDRPAFLVIDQRRNMFFGSRLKMKSVTAAELGAVGAWRVFDQGDRVGAIVFNDDATTEIRPQRSRRTVLRILGEIVRNNQALSEDQSSPSNPAMLNQALEQVSRLARHDSLVCIISDLNGANSETRRIATRLARHNDVIVGFVFDPLEQALPAAGNAVFSEGEAQLEVDTTNKKIREGFADQFSQRLSQMRRILLQRAVPLVPISTAEDPVRQIQTLLGYARSSRRRQ
jgi:uncharacterized protein (DUF58 family)